MLKLNDNNQADIPHVCFLSSGKAHWNAGRSSLDTGQLLICLGLAVRTKVHQIQILRAAVIWIWECQSPKTCFAWIVLGSLSLLHLNQRDKVPFSRWETGNENIWPSFPKQVIPCSFCKILLHVRACNQDLHRVNRPFISQPFKWFQFLPFV